MEDRMQKFVNRPEDMSAENLRGFALCYSRLVSVTECTSVLKYVGAPVAGKVGLVTGGGAGHDPAFVGYLGKNLLDAAATGPIFGPPDPQAFLVAFKHANSGRGVLCMCGNYSADLKSARIAVKLAEKEGIEVCIVVSKDDASIADKDARRGLSGSLFLWKIVGAAAANGADLAELERIAKKIISQTRSMGVGLSSCIVPIEGRPNYLIQAGTMEIGIGHHGMASLDTCKLKTADETVDIILKRILKDMPLEIGSEVAVLISGMGNTMLMELHILFGRLYDLLAEKQVKIHWSLVGNLLTSLDMMGATISILKLDSEQKVLIDKECESPAMKIICN